MTKPPEFQHAGDIAESIVIAAYDARVALLESTLAAALAMLQRKTLYPEETAQCQKMAEVLHAGE